MPTAFITDRARPLAELLNRECACITLDRTALSDALEREAADAELCRSLIGARPHLFSTAPVFLARADIDEMLGTVRAIETVAGMPAYQEAALAWAPEIARASFGPLGAFMGYDFHLAADGPRLIEVNTNAGGAFLNALLVRAQRACCAEVETALARSGSQDFEDAVARMFAQEWALQGNTGMPGRIAIVDDQPRDQYLYPEFILAQRFFLRHGIDAVIADPTELQYQGGRLLAGGRPVDLVYNRLVDFALDRPEHGALRAAYLDGAAVVTPNPRVHALFADKRNLTLLSDDTLLQSWGIPSPLRADLARVPRTVPVTPANADGLWAARKTLFFKPAGGHGGKAVYRGDKLTRAVWAEIGRGGYVAQDYAAPGARTVVVDGARVSRKVDVRLYVYDGEVLLTAARLYQGQTTNFRTPGGGFAPVFPI